jgi:hypothetical protein
MASIYDPSTYPKGVPNPFGIMVHAWNDGPYAQGTRYHGSVWTRPQSRTPWRPRPFAGLGQAQGGDIPRECWEKRGFTDCYQAVLEEAFSWCDQEGDLGYPRWQDEYGSADACANATANSGTNEFCVPKYCRPSNPNLPWILAGAAGVLMIGVAMSMNKPR